MLELIVYGLPKKERNIHYSPFCAKTMIFLKLAKLEHKLTEFHANPAKFPNSKLPVLKEDSLLVPDSHLIQKHLSKKYSLNLDAHLSEEQKAQGHAFVKMLEEHMYWCLLQERWFVEQNWERLKKNYFSHIPSFVQGFVTNMIRKSLRKSSFGHGMGRHSQENIHDFGAENIKALSDFLAQKNFLLGDQVSSYDASAYAFVANLIHSDLNPKLNNEALKHPNLLEYDQRMFSLVF